MLGRDVAFLALRKWVATQCTVVAIDAVDGSSTGT
jgi:hypothetical protein